MTNAREYTVQQLAEHLLSNYPHDAKVMVMGPDCGGYDVTFCEMMTLAVSEEINLENYTEELDSCTPIWGVDKAKLYAVRELSPRQATAMGIVVDPSYLAAVPGEFAHPENCVMIFGVTLS
jgi:hypothetical protein